MRLLHGLARTHASFDDPNLVSRAGLVPVMALAQRAGLADVVQAHVRPGGECGVNAPSRRILTGCSCVHCRESGGAYLAGRVAVRRGR